MKLKASALTITLGGKMLCRHLDIEIQTGEIWGILGPNGSGKTTLLHTLAGLNRSKIDHIWLNGNNLRNLPPRVLAQHIAILFQDTHVFFPQTVWEYCLTARFPHLPYFKKESKEDSEIVKHALEKMDLLSHRDMLLNRLSGGEKRRLAIAAVLAQTPFIYILDEPTNHLDIRHQLNVLRHFRSLVETQPTAVIMSLHDLNLAQQFCNRLLLLFENGDTLQGSPEDIMTTANLTRLYQTPIRNIAHSDKRSWWIVD
ncbi:ABC transporter ATP-binding protein [Aquicella lusitana]|uniref:Iron complex transport system ATP-binding protein n=1 Tax=Aquicella lusitana TaxID=254246 RepID=A0A370GZ63_9COXI|nr:ABC transporter ATP-binding protein [Aquicella lusitana]RDI48586.1 iron complex transport system ATP-binding protein [Aquicella lusitana]VVC74037.1 putative siderophore transport system ATP-binding protein YusV [Aquicella lusitana]